MAVMTLKATQQDTMKARLSDILMHVSWGDISREYFGKSGSWLYHKLNGVDGNKKPTEFMDLTKEELAYKLALMQSFVSEIDAESYLPRFERKYADWLANN